MAPPPTATTPLPSARTSSATWSPVGRPDPGAHQAGTAAAWTPTGRNTTRIPALVAPRRWLAAGGPLRTGRAAGPDQEARPDQRPGGRQPTRSPGSTRDRGPGQTAAAPAAPCLPALLAPAPQPGLVFGAGSPPRNRGGPPGIPGGPTPPRGSPRCPAAAAVRRWPPR